MPANCGDFMGTITPSRHLSLVTLETIAANHYTNETKSKDYDVDELNALIWDKQARKQQAADKARFDRMEREQAALDELPPPIPAEACEGIPSDDILPHGFVRRSLIAPHDAPHFRIINARWNGKCRETGELIEAGDQILWHRHNKTIFCEGSETFREYKQFFNISLPF